LGSLFTSAVDGLPRGLIAILIADIVDVFAAGGTREINPFERAPVPSAAARELAASALLPAGRILYYGPMSATGQRLSPRL